MATVEPNVYPATIADQIERLQKAKADLKTAIEGKGVTVPSNALLNDYAQKVNLIEQGGGGSEISDSKSVMFIDYDGTIVQSYTLSEFAKLSALPSNPDHTSEGLVSQGWNWTLSNAKTHVASYGTLYIGQMYITDDGATRINLELKEDDDKLFNLVFSQSITNGVSVDWGDGSSVETISGSGSKTLSHTYIIHGIYTISLLPSNNCTLSFDGSPYGYTALFGSTNNTNTFDINRGTVNSINLGRNINVGQSGVFGGLYRLQSVTIPSNITNIGRSTFYNCYSLRSLTIPSGVTTINDRMFYSCYSLQSVTIPNSVTSIGTSSGNKDVFYYCYSLRYISIPRYVTKIYNYTFHRCTSLSKITLPNNITDILDSAFYGCYSLQSINIPNGVKSIGTYAFSGCYSLQSINIPSSVTSIQNGAFSGCASLQSVNISSGVTNIGTNVFSGCYSLRSITIPNSVTSIGSGVFSNCLALLSVTMPSGITSISSSTFSNCYSLQNITIPNGVTSIGNSAFDYCNSLISINIPNGVTSIDNSAFTSCGSLQSVTIPSSVTSIGTNAFGKLYNIIIERTTPPTLAGSSNSLGSTSYTFPIYVPDSAVETYKSAYTNYASRIKGISERP